MFLWSILELGWLELKAILLVFLGSLDNLAVRTNLQYEIEVLKGQKI
jgi:hypothetical protein